ncbi:MAG: ribosome recycling factor [Bryobacteraceae bacterium]
MKPEQQPPSTPQQTVKDIENHARGRMEKVLTDLQQEMSNIRTGRANIGLLDGVKIDYFGTPTPVNQVATLNVPEPFMITLQPWDSSQIAAIEKAIRNSDLGLNPGNDGKIIRVPIPQLTEERRKEFVKKLHHVAEEHRVGLRNVRRDANESVKKLLKDKLISEDEDRRAHEEIQKLIDAYTQKLELAQKAKEKEIMEIK